MSDPTTAPHEDPHHERRWLILGILGVAQLMVVLDATIVNVALPSVQRDLGFSDGNRQWIITAYALAFGSLLLIGGRLGDLFGRKRAFVIGLGGFAIASALGGIAQSFGLLVAARALQGIFGALLAPSALGLLTVTFTDPAERGKAFGIFSAIAGGGAAIGLLLGGVLTEYLNWRWCLFVNLAFALPAALGALSLLHDTRHGKPVLDWPGTITATLGLFSLVYGFSRAESDGWTDPLTLGCFAACVVLLGSFFAIQRRVEHPLLPLRIVANRNRGGAYLGVGMTGVGMFGIFLFLTFYLQRSLGFSPIRTGLAFLPMSFAIISSATTAATKLLPRFGPRKLMPTGMLLAAAALLYLAQIDSESGYLVHVLPALLVLGVGVGQVFAPAFSTATVGVDRADAGVASAMVNTVQQVGGAIGTALLSTIAVTATSNFGQGLAAGAQPSPAATIHGYTTAFYVASAMIAVGSVLTFALLRPGTPAQHAAQDAEAAGLAAAAPGPGAAPAPAMAH